MRGAGTEKTRGPALGAAAGWGVATWAACGLTMMVGRAAFGLEAALAIHLAAAPAISVVATVLCWNHRRHPGPVATATFMAGVPAALDALVVAPLLERSYAMFASPVGTWDPLALIFLASLATARLLSRPPQRWAFLGWMATPAEQRQPLPGDQWIAVEDDSTLAIGIAAPPSAVWPWLAQMGVGRAGWYSHDRLDNRGRRSAQAIHPEWQTVGVGDRWQAIPDGRTFFEVLEAAPGRHLVLGLHAAAGSRASLPWSEPSPPQHQRGTWSFALQPAGPAAGRLLVRVRATSPARPWRPRSGLFWLAHVVMQRKQLLGIRRRAERAS